MPQRYNGLCRMTKVLKSTYIYFYFERFLFLHILCYIHFFKFSNTIMMIYIVLLLLLCMLWSLCLFSFFLVDRHRRHYVVHRFHQYQSQSPHGHHQMPPSDNLGHQPPENNKLFKIIESKTDYTPSIIIMFHNV